MTPPAISVAAAVVLLLAIALFIAGVRGRRSGDWPRCRRCGYDLTGRSTDSARCSECGADFDRRGAIQIGRRVSRRTLLGVGVLLATPSAFWLGAAGWDAVRAVDLTPYKPVSWLRRDLDGNPIARRTAFDELLARVRAGRLSSVQVADLSDRALAGQLSPTLGDPSWSWLIEAARAKGTLDAQRWLNYAERTTSASLEIVGPIMPGNRVPVNIKGSSSPPFRVPFDVHDWQIDGRPVPESDLHWPVASEFAGHQGRLDEVILSSTNWPTIALPDLPPLAPGRHSLTARVRVDVYNRSDYPQGAQLPLQPMDPAKRLTVLDLPVSAGFTLPAVAPTTAR